MVEESDLLKEAESFDQPTMQNEEEVKPVIRPAPKSKTTLYLGAAIGILVLAGIIFMIESRNAQAPVFSGICGPGGSCLSKSEVTSLFGPGAKYNSSYITNPSQVGLMTNDTNTTAMWSVIYTNYSANIIFVQFTSRTTSPKALYNGAIFKPYHLHFNASNATVNGLTYSLAYGNYSGTIKQLSFYGYKNGEFVTLNYVGNYAPDTTDLPGVISRDMP